MANRQTLATLTRQDARIESLAWSPDGGILASASANKSVRLWDMAPLYDRRSWPERIAEAKRIYQLQLVGLDLKPLSAADNRGR